MRILGVDSSGMVASVALVEDDLLVAEYSVNYKKTHSQTLLPMLDEIVKMTELDLNTIDAIAVAAGPGSFTGLRIGSATAKGLGLALEKPILNVPTVDALAYNLVGHRDMVCPLMDARRNQTYTGLYRFDGNDMQVLRGECAVGIDEIAADINSRGEAVVFLGDGFRHLFQHHIFVFAKKSSLIRHIIKLCTCLLGCGYIHAEYKRDYKRQQETAYSLFHFSALPSVPKAAAQSRRWR